MAPTKKIKFLIDVSVENQGKVSFKAKAGEVKELSTSSANRWLKRDKAVIYIQAKAQEEKPQPLKTTVKKANAKQKAEAKTKDK